MAAPIMSTNQSKSPQHTSHAAASNNTSAQKTWTAAVSARTASNVRQAKTIISKSSAMPKDSDAYVAGV